MSFIFTLLFAGSFYSLQPPTVIPYESIPANVQLASVRKDETDVTEGTYPISPDGKISVSNINGSIEVTGWDRPEVHIVTTKIASSRERMGDVDVKITARQDVFRVEVDYKRRKGTWVKNDNLRVNFKLMVPRTAVVDEAESVNGSVTVSELTNIVRVSAVNGAVRGTQLRGDVKLSTVNGSLLATFDQLEPDAKVFLSTVNGSAQISLPSNVNATIKADSVNGSITNDFGLPVKKGKYVGRDLYGVIGTGESTITLNTVNGGISVTRNDDGLTVNPVRNLLKQKTSDDFDDSYDDQSVVIVQADKIAAEAVRVASDSIRASRDVEREALRQSERIAREAVTVSAEAISAAMADVRTVEFDQERAERELAAEARTLSGNGPAPFILEDSKTVKVKGVPNVQVKAIGCNVTVKGWDRDEVKYVVSRLARGRTSPVKNVGFTNEESEIRLNVQVVGAAAPGQVLDQVTVEVFVPRKSNLKIDTDREIRLVGVAGDLDLNGQAGGIDVRDAGGSLDVESFSGTVRVIGFEGALDSRVGNADVYLDGDFEMISSHSRSGKVYLTLLETPGALIKTNSMGLNGTSSEKGETVTINGIRFKQKAEDLWQVGKGGADYKFMFNGGSLIVRPRLVEGTE